MRTCGKSVAGQLYYRQMLSSKNGSSLALVVILAAVLVLLGTTLLPVAITADSEAEKMETRYENYLISRSAIEYAKGELACLIQSEPPCTFAVLQDSAGFRAVRKMDGGVSVNSDYAACIDYDPLGRADDAQDRPKASAAGDRVLVICAVVPTENPTHPFEITICSYVKKEVSLTCKADYKEEGIQ